MTAQAVNKSGAAHAAPKRPARKMPRKQLLGIAGILAFLWCGSWCPGGDC